MKDCVWPRCIGKEHSVFKSSILRRFVKEEGGQVLVLTLLTMGILMGFLALAVDVGTLFNAKRKAQIAADAAAIAGAMEYNYNGATNAVSVAKSAAAANGVPSGDVTVSLTGGGYHTGTGYVAATVTVPTPTIFLGAFNAMGHFGSANTMNVSAGAVAGTVPGPACFYITDPSDANVMNIQGSSSIITPNCGIVIDSNSADALCVTGNSNSIQAPYLYIVGSQNPAGRCSKIPGGGTPIQTGVLPQTDPFGNFPGATPQNGQCTNPQSISSITGTYNTGYGQVTCFSNAVTLTNATLGPGTYVFFNGVNLSGTVTVGQPSPANTTTNLGATLDIQGGTFNQNNATLSIYAPQDLSNPYNSIALMQPSSNTTGTCQNPHTITPCIQAQFGSSNGNLSGYIYAPKSELYLQDSGGGTQVGGVVAYQLYNKTSTLQISNSFNKANPSVSALSQVQLVE
jgi:Flp pilus assembly protein TadG